MKYLIRFIKNLYIIIQMIVILILFIGILVFIFAGGTLIIIALFNPSLVKQIGIWKSIVFVLIYISSLAFFKTFDEIQSGDKYE